MSSGLSCPNCHSSELEQDSARGDVVCTGCGSVLEDNLIVSEVQFEEGNHGASHIVGQRVGEEGFKPLSVGGIMGSGKESRQVTLDNAKKKISVVGAQLRLSKHCMDMAFNFYKRALQRRLTHGRKSLHVIAACVYITCRTEGTPHMLLDLSDVMQVNVYELGRTYLKLSSSLCLTIQAIDPCFYINRFANKLELGDKSFEIEKTAMRIVQRMKRDWMHFGRRPSGLCGAALLVAARLRDTHCSVKQIIDVVKVCEATIRKRLSEFGDTPTSKLTLDEFMSVDLEEEEDPPCFKAARKKIKVPDPEAITEYEGEMTELQEQIEKELENSRKKSHAPWAKYLTVATSSDGSGQSSFTEGTSVDENEITAQFVAADTIETMNEIIGSPMKTAAVDLTSEEQLNLLRPTASSLGIHETFGLSATISSNINDGDATKVSCVSVDAKGDGELYIDDIDDDEIDGYILNDHEAGMRQVFWEKINADWIKENAEKAQKKAEEEAERKVKEEQGELPPKKKRRVKKRVHTPADDAGVAIEKMLIEKRISNKINYDVLKKLDVTKSSVVDTRAADDLTPQFVAVDQSPIKRLPSIHNTASMPNLMLSRRTPIKISTPTREIVENAAKKVKFSIAEDKPVVEEEPLDEDDDDETDTEPAAPTQLSISELMSQHRAGEFDDVEEEYEESVY